MNNKYGTQAAVALKPVRTQPRLIVIQDIRPQRSSLVDELAMQLFGHLHGADFSSDVHDVLDMRVRPGFLGGSRERIFACVASAIAVVALFAFSFL